MQSGQASTYSWGGVRRDGFGGWRGEDSNHQLTVQYRTVHTSVLRLAYSVRG